MLRMPMNSCSGSWTVLIRRATEKNPIKHKRKKIVLLGKNRFFSSNLVALQYLQEKKNRASKIFQNLLLMFYRLQYNVVARTKG
jgi:hypothetical protein